MKRETSTLQQQARALGDPTRHAIFRHIVQVGRAIGVAELNEHFPYNHNAIREHLAKLVTAGLLVEERAPTAGRGRPRLVYTVNPVADGLWGVTSPYERLSRLLVEIIRSGLSPVEIGRRAADDLRVASPSGDASADIGMAMARQGFMPEVRPGRRGAVEVALRNCPFETAAQADRETVCALHLGIAEGLAEGTDLVVGELIANDPARADCRLRLHPAASEGKPSAGRLTLRGRARRVPKREGATGDPAPR